MLPDSDDTWLSEASTLLPGRLAELSHVWGLLGRGGSEPLPPALLVWGPRAAGKRAVMRMIARRMQRQGKAVCAEVDCAEGNVMAAINALLMPEADPVRGDCLAEQVRRLGTNLTSPDQPCLLLILRRAERLRGSRTLPVLLRLRQLRPQLKVCTVLVSHLPWERWGGAALGPAPLAIHFPPYTREQLTAVLATDREECMKLAGNAARQDLYSSFLTAFLAVYWRVCRDPRELRRAARGLFQEYCRPLKSEQTSGQDVTFLWRQAAPAFRAGLQGLYLRLEGPQEVEGPLELPMLGKCLLVAAFLASYNPAKEDKRLFMKNHGKKRKTLRDVKAKAVIVDKSQMLLGPQSFPLERLLALLYALAPAGCALTAGLQAQLGGLRALGLMAKRGDRLVCTAALPTVKTAAQHINIDLDKYLYDRI